MPRKTANSDDPKPQRQRNIAAQAKASVVKPKRKRGRPTLYSEKMGIQFCERLSNGETVTAICKDIGIHPHSIYMWMQNHPVFYERYKIAKEYQAVSLLNELLDETKDIEPNKALAMRVRSDLVKWFASKMNPMQFGDNRKIELSAQVNHQHTHNLTVDQKRRIAESWLLSQTNDVPLIQAETTGPDIPVRTVSDQSPREIPSKKALEAPKPKRKIKSDDDW